MPSTALQPALELALQSADLDRCASRCQAIARATAFGADATTPAARVECGDETTLTVGCWPLAAARCSLPAAAPAKITRDRAHSRDGHARRLPRQPASRSAARPATRRRSGPNRDAVQAPADGRIVAWTHRARQARARSRPRSSTSASAASRRRRITSSRAEQAARRAASSPRRRCSRAHRRTSARWSSSRSRRRCRSRRASTSALIGARRGRPRCRSAWAPTRRGAPAAEGRLPRHLDAVRAHRRAGAPRRSAACTRRRG